MDADEALKKLIEGNARYVEASTDNELISPVKYHEVIPKQEPFAVILGCSDSRVPPEIAFGQGMGDLFVIRVAGNIAEPAHIGSVEFACQQFKTQLVVVLGHTGCGAVSATVDSLINPPDQISPNLAAIVDRVAQAVHPTIFANESDDQSKLLHKAMRANVKQSVQILESRSAIIRTLIEQGKLKVVGAEYSIETGKVEFYL